MSVEIKQVDPKEHEKFIKKLWFEYNSETGYHLNEDKKYYIILYNGEKAGYLHIKIVATVAYLSEIILKSEFRGKKIGHQLMEFFENIAKEHKCHKMRIKTCPDIMKTAHYLYNKFGFKEEATLKNDYFNKDWVILSKYL